jgi:hypothetical protein
VTFSDDEEEEEAEEERGPIKAGDENEKAEGTGPTPTMMLRVPPRSTNILGGKSHQHEQRSTSSSSIHYNNSDDDSEDDEEEEEFDEEEDFERMKELIRKKFSITGADDDLLYDPIEV